MLCRCVSLELSVKRQSKQRAGTYAVGVVVPTTIVDTGMLR